MSVKPWAIIALLLLVSVGLNIWVLSDRSSAGESLAGVRDELSVARRRSVDLKAELLRSTEDNQKLIELQRESTDQSERIAEQLRQANQYIYQLESQIRISDESIGRLDGLIERGNALIEEGRSLLEGGSD